MAETFSDNEARSSIRAKLNRNADELSVTSQTALTASNTLASLISRVTALEAGTSGTGSVSTSDGTLTAATFDFMDVFYYSYQSTGSSGQTWSKANTIAGFEGVGYGILNNISAVDGTNAIAFMDGFASDPTQPRVQVNRKVWLRVYGPTGATIAGKSHNGGTLGTGTIVTNNAWSWVEMSSLHVAYDNQYQLHGRTASVAVDRLILTTSSNTDVPTGKDGFRNA